jgi:hypothetical protein
VGSVAGAGAGLFLGTPLAVFLASLSVRIGATVRYLGPGIRNLPHNFRRLTLCTSPLQVPELVPGLPVGLPDVWENFQQDFFRSSFGGTFPVLIYFPTMLLCSFPAGFTGSP